MMKFHNILACAALLPAAAFAADFPDAAGKAENSFAIVVDSCTWKACGAEIAAYGEAVGDQGLRVLTIVMNGRRRSR